MMCITGSLNPDQVSPGGFNGGLVIMLRGRKAGTLRLATWQHAKLAPVWCWIQVLDGLGA